MDDYHQTIEYLYSLEYSGIKLGLENVSSLLTYLGNPQYKWPAIHIAGTNGKGSTAAFIFSILREAGYKVGLYTSPHLVDFSERIRINEEKISWSAIVKYTRDLKSQIEKRQATFFEATTALAFKYFADQKIDIAVIETGLGGRLDATNLVKPLLTIITSISFDHQRYLGNTLPQIAYEKAGIIKTGVPCITFQQDLIILKVFQTRARQVGADLFIIDPQKQIEVISSNLYGSVFDLVLPQGTLSNLKITLAGDFQILNAALAVEGVFRLPSAFTCSENHIRNGLVKATWPARFQRIAENPLTILDVAHNADGFKKILSFISKQAPSQKIWGIVGISRDKDYQIIADIMNTFIYKIGLVSNFSARSLDADILLSELKHHKPPPEKFENIIEAYSAYRQSAPADDLLLIIGSHYLVGEFLKKIQIS